MNTLAAMNDTPWFLVMAGARTLLVLVMAGALFFQLRLTRGTRGRYRAATVLRTITDPVTLLTAVETLVRAAAGDWWNAAPPTLLMLAMPVYVLLTDEDNGWDNWLDGRWGKIRDALNARFANTAAAVSR